MAPNSISDQAGPSGCVVAASKKAEGKDELRRVDLLRQRIIRRTEEKREL
jgi:hypothetical protein